MLALRGHARRPRRGGPEDARSCFQGTPSADRRAEEVRSAPCAVDLELMRVGCDRPAEAHPGRALHAFSRLEGLKVGLRQRGDMVVILSTLHVELHLMA